MAKSRKTAIVTYIGTDGACAAAMGLLKWPSAEIHITSAQRVGRTLGELAAVRQPPGEIHVCGLGVHGDWDEVVRSARQLKKKGVAVVWYCGRGYLDAERFAEVCSPEFSDLSSNTEAVCKKLKLDDKPNAQFLTDLACHDPNIENPPKKLPEVDDRWLELIAASAAEYFKFNDRDRYVATIHKLASMQFNADDQRLVELFGRTGMRYVLEGRSPQLRKVRDLIRKCAAAEEPVFIGGESGTGKELVANLIHERSRRATEPLVTINCARFTGNVGLANTALFGHVKGAFTGAVADRKGAFVEASGGTLFLDEVGELPLEVQAKLLRVLEEKAVVPEGADRAITNVDVLVVSATNRDLPAMIRSSGFRADLFHRLATLRIVLPPLREHPADLDGIAAKTLEQLAKRGWKRKLTKRDWASLREYNWPGSWHEFVEEVGKNLPVVPPDVLLTIVQDVPGGLSRRDGSLQGSTP